MASPAFIAHSILKLLFVISSLFHTSFGARKLTGVFEPTPIQLTYHSGPLMSGNIPVNCVWYGSFTPSQRSIITDFILSLSPSQPESQPSVATWFTTIKGYYPLAQGRNAASLSVSLGTQTLDEGYSLGKSLSHAQIEQLASSAFQTNAIVIVLTADDVLVENFCLICGNHASSNNTYVYIWVGNSAAQCPGRCAWPFNEPINGPQDPPLVAPNDDIGMDGMVINVAALVPGAISNPFGDGIFQGVATAPLEACTACRGIYGLGAYPGYPGKLLVDVASGASYNAIGVNNRMYLVPAMFSPATSTCVTSF